MCNHTEYFFVASYKWSWSAIKSSTGGVNRTQQKPTVTKEELDRQLDQYMASSKAALDLEIENYMKNAMEMEWL